MAKHNLHAFRCRPSTALQTSKNLLWRTAGVGQVLQLIVIAPLAYRPREGSKLLYRDPAYLICTDPALDARQIIETYLQRWDIEVNFRDEKTLLGIGQGGPFCRAGTRLGHRRLRPAAGRGAAGAPSMPD